MTEDVRGSSKKKVGVGKKEEGRPLPLHLPWLCHGAPGAPPGVKGRPEEAGDMLLL